MFFHVLPYLQSLLKITHHRNVRWWEILIHVFTMCPGESLTQRYYDKIEGEITVYVSKQNKRLKVVVIGEQSVNPPSLLC